MTVSSASMVPHPIATVDACHRSNGSAGHGHIEAAADRAAEACDLRVKNV